MTRTRAAVCVAAAAVVVYAVMWLGYRHGWSWVHRFDWSLLNAAHDVGVKHPVWVRFWDGVSFALGPVPLRLLGTVAAVAALVRRNVRAALVLLACAPLSGLVTMAAKALANRPRPSTMLVPTPSTSFPSGHALEATAAVLALLSFLLPMLSRSLGRVAIALAALSVLSVGVSRVALNVHYPSDALAGWSLGYLYFLLCLLVFGPDRARRPRRRRWSRRSYPTGSEALLDHEVCRTGRLSPCADCSLRCALRPVSAGRWWRWRR